MEKRLTPSLVISVIALIVALGGASYAAIKIPKNSVGAKQLKKYSVTAKKLRKNAVTSAKLKAGSVVSSKLGVDSVTRTALGRDSVDTSKVEDGGLVRADFAPGQINGDAYFGAYDGDPYITLDGAFQDLAVTPVLPAGSYVLAGRASITVSFTPSVLLCSMGSDVAQNFDIPASTTFPLSMSGVTVLTAPGRIALKCSTSFGDPTVTQTQIVATSVNSIQGYDAGS